MLKITSLNLYYRPVDFFFEKLFFNEMFKFFIENELITSNQLESEPVDLFIKF